MKKHAEMGLRKRVELNIVVDIPEDHDERVLVNYIVGGIPADKQLNDVRVLGFKATKVKGSNEALVDELVDALYTILNVEGVALHGAHVTPELDVPYHFEKVRAAIKRANKEAK